MLPTNDDCDDCRPAYLQRRLDSVPPSTIVLSTLPFVVTWIAIAVIAQQRIYPGLASNTHPREGLPVFNKGTFKPKDNERWRAIRPSAQKVSSLVFSTSIGLSAVLVELLLCEISNILNPAARGLALRVTLSLLLVLSVVITPALEIHGLVRAVFGTSIESTSTRRTKVHLRLAVELLTFGAWLVVFWYIPQASLLRHSLRSREKEELQSTTFNFTEECLERIGIIGISLMASLAGFAAVSSLWQNFGVRHKTIKDTDIARKQAGLSSTEEMLAAKQSRLRALQRKMSEAGSPSDASMFGRVIGTFRSNPEQQELKMLQMEVSGLESMRFSLSSSLSNIRMRYNEQQRSRTNTGKLLNVINTVFAVYCAYRIGATSLSSLRRWWQPNHSFATSDPINNILALLTTHWDSNLNRAAWSRQISFLLSGVMLLASFNAVLQTFRLFARFAPGLLQHAQTSLPLIISQIAGTYVISSALLLRSNLPAEVSGVITEALGAPLEGRFVEGWFESWFLAAVALTATGILIGRKVANSDDGCDDDEVGIETGSKRN